MMKDYGSRDTIFVDTIKKVRQGLLEVAKAPASEWSAIPMQGSGSMGIEAVIGSTVPQGPDAKYIVLRNGAYGTRMEAICSRLKIPTIAIESEEGVELDLGKLESVLKANPNVSAVGMVHCETSTGMFNPIHEVGALIRKLTPKATFIVDAMSSFGGVDLTVPEIQCDYIISSSNKCIQGVPGFSIIVGRKAHGEKVQGVARSFTMDLWNQAKGLDSTGQFNNTPPVHSIMAFAVALDELAAEGGVVKREARYKRNTMRTLEGYKALGFKPFLDPSKKSFGHIITGYHYPKVAAWDFPRFYKRLAEQQCVIYPGKTGKADCFRIGSIGEIYDADVDYLLACTKKTMEEMGLKL
jgi:2-aminoethylphosphonate--pyruvate transaminase